MGALGRLMRPKSCGTPAPGIDVDSLIADAEARAGLKPGAPAEERKVFGGVYVARGKSLRTLGDRIAVEPVKDFGKIGALFIPVSQTYQRAKVVSHGPKVVTAKSGLIVIVSDFFGDQVKLEHAEHYHPRMLRIGRERDIVAVETKTGLMPTGNRILAERIEPPKTAGSILLPEDIREPQFRAKVLAVGPDCTVKAGEVVLIPKQGSVVVAFNEAKMILVDEPTVLAVL